MKYYVKRLGEERFMSMHWRSYLFILVMSFSQILYSVFCGPILKCIFKSLNIFFSYSFVFLHTISVDFPLLNRFWDLYLFLYKYKILKIVVHLVLMIFSLLSFSLFSFATVLPTARKFGQITQNSPNFKPWTC